MKISKKDALMWFRFFAELPEGEELMTRQKEIVYATLSQIETAEEARIRALYAQIPDLKTLDGRSCYVGDDARFPKGCVSCLSGNGLNAVRKTNKCNLKCPFCYNYGELDQIEPIGEGLFDIGGTRFREEDIDMLLSVSRKPSGIAYVYLEPFMEIEVYYGIIRCFHEAGVHQHMYTNGTLATEENLKALAEAGLDELRFNLGASNAADRVIDNIAVAKKYIPQVGIETPMTPELYEAFLQKKDKILATGLDFINFAELHLNRNNLMNYAGKDMYMYRRGYLSPIESHELTLKMMKIASEEKWPVCVHDCDNRTKFVRDINLKAKEGGWFGASEYACEFSEIPYEVFLPILEDESFRFEEEEPLPEGYNPGEMFW